jgi:hypothetical protein
MDSKLILGVESFEGRLNLDGFTNIEKGYSSKEFAEKFSDDKFIVFEKSNIDEFIANVNKTVGGEIIKGSFNDIPEFHELIEKAKSDLSKLTEVRINDGEEKIKSVYILEKSESNDLEKGRVSEAFSYGANSMTFKKKGSDLKNKIAECKAECKAQQIILEKEIEECCADFVCQPTEMPHLYGTRAQVNCPYKVFAWNQTYYSNADNGLNSVSSVGEGGVDCQPCNSPEEASCNSKYNMCVDKWIDNCAEICTLEMYENNIEDNSSYELNPEQMLALKF